MSRLLKYHSEAAAEATEAVRWYQEQSPDAASAFFQHLQTIENTIRQFPDRGGLYLHGTRLCRFKRFPYGLVYQERDDYVLILAVAHLKRKPGYWKQRVPRV